ncbi:MAG TPA: GxxExxY protein [Gemmatimonadaceae bacterium]|nr:GxxExxY protein [Gemmatimonadaceae bacterium]
MRPLDEDEDLLTREIIGKAIAIHRVLGPGLLESVYEYFLAHELRKGGLRVEQQRPVAVEYQGQVVDLGFRPDLIVNGEVIVEVKTVEKLAPVHQAQLLSYLRLARIERGLLINFHAYTLRDGIKRLSLSSKPQFLGVPGGLGGQIDRLKSESQLGRPERSRPIGRDRR